MAVPQPEETLPTEREKLDKWRSDEFERMGFDEHAVELLVQADVSVHDAWNLLRKGCDLSTALLILL